LPFECNLQRYIGGKRFSEGTSADREIQRTLMVGGLYTWRHKLNPLGPIARESSWSQPLETVKCASV
jgi:hypothetical protein